MLDEKKQIERENKIMSVRIFFFTFVRRTGHVAVREGRRRGRRAQFHFRVIELFFVVVGRVVREIVQRGFLASRSAKSSNANNKCVDRLMKKNNNKHCERKSKWENCVQRVLLYRRTIRTENVENEKCINN